LFVLGRTFKTSWLDLPNMKKLKNMKFASLEEPTDTGCDQLNPLPHWGRPYWPNTYLNAKCSKSAEGKV
jgi:hypothetical protein